MSPNKGRPPGTQMAQEELEPTEGQGEGGGHEVTPPKIHIQGWKSGLVANDAPRLPQVPLDLFQPSHGAGCHKCHANVPAPPQPPKTEPQLWAELCVLGTDPSQQKRQKKLSRKAEFLNKIS